jgi:hypothetical protein
MILSASLGATALHSANLARPNGGILVLCRHTHSYSCMYHSHHDYPCTSSAEHISPLDIDSP